VLSIETVVIGAGQAGLAVSRCLTDGGVDHIVLERGRVAERWRSQRWDSLRLLTPNWATRLPGWNYAGTEPDGYLTAAEFADYLAGYAASFDAPVHAGTAVTSVERTGTRFTVRSNRGSWRAGNVVLATGWCDQPLIPAVARRLSPRITQLAVSSYRNPTQLPPGGVLVVGASASGVQPADELARSGRRVTLAVGRHRRLPRRYRGRDIWWWLEQIGSLRVTVDDVVDPTAARSAGALQLVGRAHPEVDLPALQALGVQLTGRLKGINGTRVSFAGDLGATTSDADRRARRVLARIDEHIAAHCLSERALPTTTTTTVAPRPTQSHLDLRRAGISTVLWATGFTRRYPWLRVPALGCDGEIRQRQGVTPVAGLYVVGQRFQHRRDSDFIDGVRHDAAMVAQHMAHRRAPTRAHGFLEVESSCR
jgi:putative flavoprotein involved in K+ transport